MDEDLLSDAVTESDAVQKSLAEAFLALIKEQVIQEFLAENDVTCPHCGDSFNGKQVSSVEETHVSQESDSDEAIDEADIEEARRLLQEIRSWTDEEVDRLPPEYKEQAENYR